ncbi:hypothetical protein [Mycoplasma phocimorsus]|uniref:hypothetical protein n=1 Tax=Mycoplasma phocimorsus TaxID=3045839 RepID=UPI0024BFD840|nr:hypothetical protein [Mycoplasma phocimorsus]MDJ1648247.1 hypothetical protein [Mycoplasma phocimorsus]
MNKNNKLIPILIDFEGISSFYVNVPYMFSLAYKNGVNEWTIVSKMIPYDKMNSNNWAESMLFELEQIIFNQLKVTNWKEFNKKFCFYAWSNEYENSVFRKIFDKEDVVISAENMIPDKIQIALDNFKDIEKDNYFVKFKHSFLSQNNSIKSILPSFINRELRDKALQHDGRLASILGFVNREINVNKKWKHLKGDAVLCTLEEELFKYSISDIRSMILLFNKANEIQHYYYEINKNKLIISSNKQKINIYDNYIELLNGLEKYNLLGAYGDLSQMLTLFFTKNNIEENEESNMIIRLYKKILNTSKYKIVGRGKHFEKNNDYDTLIKECQALCRKCLDANDVIYEKIRQKIRNNNLKINLNRGF